MLVIVPSRGRPENISNLVHAWRLTESDATLLVVVDDDDPKLAEYLDVMRPLATDPQFQLEVRPRKRLGPTLSEVAVERVARAGTIGRDIIGFMGDDHRPRTHHWDQHVSLEFMRMGIGIVYGNDLIQGPNLPTAVFMSAAIIAKLGYMCPPGFIHMYLDNTWKAWGEGMGRLAYRPDIIIEHVHPVVGKAAWDGRYQEVAGFMGPDEQAWQNYKASRLNYDVERLKELV